MADFQSNFDYHTMTPASGAADALQNILADRRNRERQAMIDEINRKNIESEISTRQDNAATNKVYRDSQALLNEQKRSDMQDAHDRRDRFSTALRNFQLPNGDPTHPMGPYEPGSPEVHTPSAAESFTPEQHRAFGLLQALGPDDPQAGSLLNTLVTRTETPDQQFEDASMVNTRSGAITSFPGHKVKKGTAPHFFDPEEYVHAGQGGAVQPTYLFNDPRTNQPVFSTNRMGPADAQHPNGRPILMYQDGTPYEGPIVDKNHPNGVGSKFASGVASKLAALKKAATPPQHNLFGYEWTGTPNNRDVEAYKQERDLAIGNYPTTTKVRQLVPQILEDRHLDPAATPSQIADQLETEHQLTPAEKNDLIDILGVLR